MLCFNIEDISCLVKYCIICFATLKESLKRQVLFVALSCAKNYHYYSNNVADFNIHNFRIRGFPGNDFVFLFSLTGAVFVAKDTPVFITNTMIGDFLFIFFRKILIPIDMKWEN